MKKSIAIILSIVLLITVAMPVFAGADPSFVPDGNQWYIDSGVVPEGQPVQDYRYETERSCYWPEENDDDNFLEDLFTFHSSNEIIKFEILGDEEHIFRMDPDDWTVMGPDGWTVVHDDRGWHTTIQFYKIRPENGGFKKDDVYTATGRITFSDKSFYEYPMKLTIMDDVAATFTEESDHAFTFKKGKENPVGIKVTGWSGDASEIYAQWMIEDVDGNDLSKLYAGFTPKPEDNKDYSHPEDNVIAYISDFTMKDGILISNASIYGYRPGTFVLNCIIFNNDGKSIANNRNVDAEVIGVDPVDDTLVVDAISQIESGNSSATIEVPYEQGLTSNHLEALKEATQKSGEEIQITLKPEEQNGIDLEMSFPASKIDTANMKDNFTPSFSRKMPTEAQENGYSEIATSTWLQFVYDGVPPAPMTIKMKAPDGVEDGDTVVIYHWDEETKKLEVETEAKCEEGYIKFTLDHFSSYAVYPEGVNPNPNQSKPTTSYRPQSAGSSGGGGGSTSSSSSSVSKRLLNGSALDNINAANHTATAKTVSVADATSAANKAADQAKAGGKTRSYVRFVNPAAISKAALDAIQKVSTQKGIQLSVYADTIVNNMIVSRMYVDPAAYTLPTDLKTSIITNVPTVKAHFNKYFKNKLQVVGFTQQGSLGTNIAAAVKLDFNGMDTSRLILYSYDAVQNRYSILSDQTYFIDVNGYLHFTTSEGNYIIVSEGQLR